MGANPHANGGMLSRSRCRTSATTPSRFRSPARDAEATRVQGKFIRDVLKLNMEAKTSASSAPTRTAPTAGSDVFEVTNRDSTRRDHPVDDHVAPDGRVMEMLSEHQCQGWLEGYLLTGRHGFFSCYEAFIHIIDSMFNQHAKWLKVTRHIPWRRPIASLNYLLTSHVWRQDHNGFSHQDPGFIDHVVNKKADVVRVYLPPDANTLLSVTDHCLRSRNYVNVIVAGKQPAPQWLDMDAGDQALHGRHRHLGVGQQRPGRRARRRHGLRRRRADARNAGRRRPAPRALPDLKVRVVNVVDLMTLQPASEHPHGMDDREFDVPLHQGQARHLRLSRLPVADPPPHLPPDQPRQHPRPRLQRGGHDHHAFRHGGAERPRPFPPCAGRDRPRSRLGRERAYIKQAIRDKLLDHREYVRKYGDDMPEVRDWQWRRHG